MRFLGLCNFAGSGSPTKTERHSRSCDGAEAIVRQRDLSTRDLLEFSTRAGRCDIWAEPGPQPSHSMTLPSG